MRPSGTAVGQKLDGRIRYTARIRASHWRVGRCDNVTKQAVVFTKLPIYARGSKSLLKSASKSVTLSQLGVAAWTHCASQMGSNNSLHPIVDDLWGGEPVEMRVACAFVGG